MEINSARGLFPVTKKYIYFNHAAVAPLSIKVLSAINEFLSDVSFRGNLNMSGWDKCVEETRAKFARLINAAKEEVAIVKNTTEGISIVANGMDWRPGDNLITADVEFPANAYPWMNLAPEGVETRFVSQRDGKIHLEDIEKLIDDRTRLISLSFVEYADGCRNDLEAIGRICQLRGIYFFVDAIQGLGALPVDVRRFNIDFLCASGHKWLLGPEGCGGFFCSAKAMEMLRVRGVGWKSVADPYDFSKYNLMLHPSARRFEGGTLNLPGVYGFKAAIELILDIGVEAIEQKVLRLTDLGIELLKEKGYHVVSPLDREMRSGIVLFKSQRHTAIELNQKLLEKGVVASVRAGGVRISPHFYNTEEEIERFARALP